MALSHSSQKCLFYNPWIHAIAIRYFIVYHLLLHKSDIYHKQKKRTHTNGEIYLQCLKESFYSEAVLCAILLQ